jgi:hypothetical protein
MTRKYKNLIRIIPACIVSGFLACARAPIAGDVTETGNATVAGMVIDCNLFPAKNTLIRLVPASFNPVADQQLPDSLTDTTDSLGRYSITTQRAGSFNVIATRMSDSSGAIVKNIELVPDSSIEAPAGILAGNGALSVQAPVNADSLRGYIYLKGTPFFSLMPSANAGAVFFAKLPACITPGIYYASTSESTPPVLLADSTEIVSRDTTFVTLLNRGASLLIGIDDWTKGYAAVKNNHALFDIKTMCANSGVNSGWYTWQPNGTYVSGKIAQAESLGLRPAFVFQNFSENSFDSIKGQLGDANYMNLYFSQYTKALQMISGSNAIILIEPITLAYYAQRAMTYPATCLPGMEPALVRSSGVSQVQGYSDNFVGFMQACVGLARSIAPDASIGMYLMNWALWTSASTDELVYWSQVERDNNIKAWNNFLGQLNVMGSIDFISFGKNRSDAGISGAKYYWTSTQFSAFLNYSAALRTTFGKPLVGWLLPIGHMGLPNTTYRYEDVFAEYFFSHSKDFRNAGFSAMLFGKYDVNSTDISETAGVGDDGWFINQLRTWRNQ